MRFLVVMNASSDLLLNSKPGTFRFPRVLHDLQRQRVQGSSRDLGIERRIERLVARLRQQPEANPEGQQKRDNGLPRITWGRDWELIYTNVNNIVVTFLVRTVMVRVTISGSPLYPFRTRPSHDLLAPSAGPGCSAPSK